MGFEDAKETAEAPENRKASTAPAETSLGNLKATDFPAKDTSAATAGINDDFVIDTDPHSILTRKSNLALASETSPEALAKLAKESGDFNWQIRANVANNPNAPSETLQMLVKNDEGSISNYAAEQLKSRDTANSIAEEITSSILNIKPGEAPKLNEEQKRTIEEYSMFFNIFDSKARLQEFEAAINNKLQNSPYEFKATMTKPNPPPFGASAGELSFDLVDRQKTAHSFYKHKFHIPRD
ncbi:MAG: hypothetical protein K2W82_07295 [Candidatus Obscuribacterales bacterium]|nr:hypothetical protein [Candidatus Obscuribacterales bacterium]